MKPELENSPNVYRAVHLCSPDEIIVKLSGDDWLAHSKVLTKLNLVYQNPDIWMTYGQFSRYLGDPCEKIRRGTSQYEVVKKNARSTNRGTTVFAGTFYAGLFQQIKKEDLFYQGVFFQVASDLAFMFPMLEMAGNHRQEFDLRSLLYL